MNWILEAYSDVYTTAALRDVKAKTGADKLGPAVKTVNFVAKFFRRG